jgi:2-oxoisovalerate ferredoxin oxidoreductase alpha subunit
MDVEDLEAVNIRLNKKYDEIRAKEQRAEEYCMEDAEFVYVAYGISSRMTRTAVDELRAAGYKVGMIRPQTLFPFPEKALNKALNNGAKAFCAVEMSNGQMIDDVKLSINCQKPVHLINRMGGFVPSVEEIVERTKAILDGGAK